MNGVRTMLVNRKLPARFWNYAAKTFVYIINRCVNKKTIEVTPYQLFYGEPPRVDHIKVFGCLAFVETQMKKRSGYQPKLEERARKALFLGNDQMDYSYIVYELEEKKIIHSRDVAFDEKLSINAEISDILDIRYFGIGLVYLHH